MEGSYFGDTIFACHFPSPKIYHAYADAAKEGLSICRQWAITLASDAAVCCYREGVKEEFLVISGAARTNAFSHSSDTICEQGEMKQSRV